MSQLPTDQEAFAQLVKGRSDQEINETLAAVGVDAVLDQIFQAMRERFNAEAAAGQTATIQWDITAPDATHHYLVRVADGTCTVERGADEQPGVTLGLALADFARFASGELDGMSAFMAGKLKLLGNMGLAQSVQTWFA